MPKPMQITIDVEELYFGKIWRTLDTMPGVVHITYKGEGPKKPNDGAAVKPGKKNASTSLQIVLKALAASKTPLDKQTIQQLLADGGKRPTTYPYTIAELKRRKQIKSVKGGFAIILAGLKAVKEMSDKETSNKE